MQDVLRLRAELAELARAPGHEGVEAVLSGERWNPLAAAVVAGLRLPPGLTPEKVDLRVPIPNLYGFASSAYVVLLREPIALDGGRAPLPGLHRLEDRCIANHRWKFVDFRERPGWDGPLHTFFLTPAWNPEGFVHVPLAEFLGRVRDFLRDPRGHYAADLRACEARWRETREPWWLVRIVQLLIELGDVDRAREVARESRDRLPGRREFAALLALVEEAASASPGAGINPHDLATDDRR